MEITCHCENISLEFNKEIDEIESLTECNCTICRRIGALWFGFEPSDVVITSKTEPTVAYLRSAGELAFHHCPKCGCTTHYETTEKCSINKIAINGRLLDMKNRAKIKVNKFDGATSWKFVDEWPENLNIET